MSVSRLIGSKSVVRRPLVLAVDDNEDNLLMLVHALELFGFASISTLEGQAVLALAETHQPDLILLDIVMVDSNGIDIVQQLRRNLRTEQIPIVAVTALASVEDRRQMLDIGCNDCLSKPYDINALQVLLEHYLHPVLSASEVAC
ncbi:response regulator [Oculatella sp. LEGE 06141]|uniref:response regulator n=1 Tax=Oculatella sp. LEGE 06141 TaxID=1828648 RepID=UPI0018803498|nr:response regulator [Oculatella sp. LEGE 06141]MBE9177058.1 response regulator [Oculatella sp. LEGE 06141]